MTWRAICGRPLPVRVEAAESRVRTESARLEAAAALQQAQAVAQVGTHKP
jgi:hypothetical protein